MKEEKEFVAKMLEQLNRLWNNGEISLAGDILTPDFVRHEPGAAPIKGPHTMGQDIENLRQQFPDLIITFEENIFDGQTMAIQWRFRGTDLGKHPVQQTDPTGKKVDYKGVDVLHIKDGKIAEDFAYFDQVTIMQQLGLMPEQAL